MTLKDEMNLAIYYTQMGIIGRMIDQLIDDIESDELADLLDVNITAYKAFNTRLWDDFKGIRKRIYQTIVADENDNQQ